MNTLRQACRLWIGLVVVLWLCPFALAGEHRNLPSPSVSALSDVSPSAWSRQALQSLIGRYNLSSALPQSTSKTFTLTRQAFAVGLMAVLVELTQRQQSGAIAPLPSEDLILLTRLQTEFAPELTALSSSIPATHLSPRPKTERVTPITQMTIEVLVAATAVGPGTQIDDSDEAIASNPTLGYRTRVSIDTTFTGEDRLRVRLQASNIARIDNATGTDTSRLAFQGDSNGQVELSRLEYRLKAGDRLTLYLEGVGGSLNDFVDTLNPELSGSAQGSLSRFAQRNPVYRQGDGAGLGVDVELSSQFNLGLGYLAEDTSDPDQGFQQSAYGAIAQLTFKPSKDTGLGLTYVRSVNSLDTNTGTERANDPFDDESNATRGHSFGVQTALELSDDLTLSGWFGLTRARALDLPDQPSAEVINWAIALALSDVGGKGNRLGILVGQPPRVTRSTFQLENEPTEDSDVWHLEAFYRYRLSDQSAITPGLYLVINPEDKNTVVGVLSVRTVFEL